MKFVIRFLDNEENKDKRAQFMRQHLEFLHKHRSNVMFAGPLFDIDTNNSSGGLWIVEAESLNFVQNLAQEDPLYSVGLRKDVNIFEWKTVFERPL